MLTFRSSRLSAALAALLLIVGGLTLVRGQAIAESSDQPAQQATATPSGQIILPTATATLPGGATATPSRTPTFPIVLVEAFEMANLRSGPGLGFDIVGVLDAGNPIPVIGRSVNFPWFLVEWPDAPDGVAWVFSDLVSVQGDITTIPLAQEPIVATVDPTLAALQATATIILQTPGAAETGTAAALIAPTGIFTSTPATGGLSSPPPPQFTQAPETGQIGTLPENRDPSTGTAIPPAMVILTLGSLGILALVLSVLRR